MLSPRLENEIRSPQRMAADGQHMDHEVSHSVSVNVAFYNPPAFRLISAELPCLVCEGSAAEEREAIVAVASRVSINTC
jgi:hypothetical protein